MREVIRRKIFELIQEALRLPATGEHSIRRHIVDTDIMECMSALNAVRAANKDINELMDCLDMSFGSSFDPEDKSGVCITIKVLKKDPDKVITKAVGHGKGKKRKNLQYEKG